MSDIDTPQLRVASFWDLDKTIIADSSVLAFSKTLWDEHLISLRLAIRSKIGSFVYKTFGANERRLQKIKDAALEMTEGWDPEFVRNLVERDLKKNIGPLVFADAVKQIKADHDAGYVTVIVSSAPEALVGPIAELLGVDHFISTEVGLENGRYSSDPDKTRFIYGDEKPIALAAFALEHGIDLAGSVAYSDCHTDIPMLDAVGTAVAINPKKKLREHAEANGWQIRSFVDREMLPEIKPDGILDNRAVRVGASAAAAATVAGTAAVLARRAFRSR